MPGSKRKIDEDTWIVSQSKKFKQGILLSSVYGKTFTHKTAPTSVHFVRSSLVCVKLSHFRPFVRLLYKYKTKTDILCIPKCMVKAKMDVKLRFLNGFWEISKNTFVP